MTETEREMLELAAKAAGYRLEWCDSWPGGGCYMRVVEPAPVDPIISKRTPWQPLDDDSDALRLAVVLPIIDIGRAILEAWQACGTEQDRSEYVRHALVRSAAGIGRAMQ
jgi:hypothetical protein